MKVFRTREDMHAYWEERSRGIHYRRGQRAAQKDWEAQVTWYRNLRLLRGRWRRHPECGEIVFHQGRLGAGLVSHEMTHAASFHLAWDRNLDPHPRNRRAHESLCIVQGWLVSQFWAWWYRKMGPNE